MKTSHRKYNNQYRLSHWNIDGGGNPEIVPECNEHKRCDVCRCHVKENGEKFGIDEMDEQGNIVTTWVYTCPTCGKSYGVQHYISKYTHEPCASISSLLAEYGECC